jgi:hypothetical protein
LPRFGAKTLPMKYDFKVRIHWRSFFGKTAGNIDTQMTTALALVTLGGATQVRLFLFLVTSLKVAKASKKVRRLCGHFHVKLRQCKNVFKFRQCIFGRFDKDLFSKCLFGKTVKRQKSFALGGATQALVKTDVF